MDQSTPTISKSPTSLNSSKSCHRSYFFVIILVFFITLLSGLTYSYLSPKKVKIAQINNSLLYYPNDQEIPSNPTSPNPPIQETTITINELTTTSTSTNNTPNHQPPPTPSTSLTSSSSPTPFTSTPTPPTPNLAPTSVPTTTSPFTSPSNESPPSSLLTFPDGDANEDGKVDELDFAIWQNNYERSTSRGHLDADFNRDGLVNGKDYAIWFNNYQT